MKKSNVRRLLPLLCLALTVVLVGCGQPKVSGKVTFADGSPLTAGTVNFVGDDVICKGDIDKDGSFEMRTMKPGDGVPPGSYQVYITGAFVFEQEDAAGQTGDVQIQRMTGSTNVLPPKYSDPEQSGLTITVDKSMKYDITLEGDSPVEEAAE